MRVFLRTYFRIAALSTWLLLGLLIVILVYPLNLHSQVLRRRVRRFLIRCWAKRLWSIIGMKVEVRGPIPQPPYYLIANHLTYVDTFLFGGILGCTFVGKHDIAEWPFIGWMAKIGDVIFVNRASLRDALRVNEEIAQAIAWQDGLVVFVESTTSNGSGLLPFKSALLDPAAKNGWPVYYASLHYAKGDNAPPAGDYICWWRAEPFFEHVKKMVSFPSSRAIVTFGETPILETDRKVLTQKLQDAVQDIFIPIEQAQETAIPASTATE